MTQINVKKKLNHFKLFRFAVIIAVLSFLFSTVRPPRLYPQTAGKKLVVILKADDIIYKDQWKKYIKYIEDKKLKTSVGVVASLLNNQVLSDWMKELAKKSYIQVWNHGLTHACTDDGGSEFKGKSYEDQLLRLQESQTLIKEKLNVDSTTFGAPCNYIDNNTARAVSELDEIETWYFGKSTTDKFLLDRFGNIEYPTSYPNYTEFVDNFNKKNLGSYSYLVFQIHPGHWDDNNRVEFEKIMNFLFSKNAVFMTPDEYLKSITETIAVTTLGNSGTGSLRAAIDRANANTLIKKRTIIRVPAGTIVLSGKSAENSNAGGDLDIRANVTIEGAGMNSTIIDGNQNDRVFHILQGCVRISGMTITNGKAGTGGGIRIDGGISLIADCKISNNKVVGSVDTGGGGIYVQKAKVSVTRSTIYGNSGSSDKEVLGGGIRINGASTPNSVDIRESIIEGNYANNSAVGTGLGGGLYIDVPNELYEVVVLHNTIKGNTANKTGQGFGGGLYLAGVKNAIIERNRVIANTASSKGNGSGGALFVNEGTNLSMTNNLVANNHAGTAGGGIYLNGTTSSDPGKILSAALLQNTIADNNRGNGGEGIYINHYAVLSLSNNIISGNSRGLYTPVPGGTSSIQLDTNLFFNQKDPILGTGSIRKDPLLSSDYKISKKSPAVNAGKTIDSINRDLQGTARPQNNLYDLGCYELIPALEPVISLNKKAIYFADSGSVLTDPQLIFISNTGTGVLNWTADPDAPWIQIAPNLGTDSGIITIQVDPTGLSAGLHPGTITISAPGAINSPQQVEVHLMIYAPGSSNPPFGDFATPGNNTAGVTGSVAFTGWALDDIQVDSVQIYLQQGTEMAFIGNAVFIEGARPDIEQTFPQFPFNYKAGWGYMLLTNSLPQKGTGKYTFCAVAQDREGNRATLGQKIITCDNLHSVKPFGNIDTPGQGETIPGNNDFNWGWALTPQPNKIPIEGSTITVIVDGVKQGHPAYGVLREDIASFFPDYNNSKGAGGYFRMDNLHLKEGMHSIQWLVKDSAGNVDGFGSRFFFVRYNTPQLAEPGNGFLDPQKPTAFNYTELLDLPIDFNTPITIENECVSNFAPQQVYPESSGICNVRIKELECVKIRFHSDFKVSSAYMMVGQRFKPSPIGSTLDKETGVFHWMPGPGFNGLYRLVFILQEPNGELRQKRIHIRIDPKF